MRPTHSEPTMRIGQLAGRFDLNPKTIRFYESIGLLPEPVRTSGGYRLYGDSDAERLQFIRTAQRLGPGPSAARHRPLLPGDRALRRRRAVVAVGTGLGEGGHDD